MRLTHQEYMYQASVWIGVLCIVLAGTFMGLSVLQLDLRWAGILFSVLSVVVLLLFVLLRCHIKKRGGNTDMCALFTDGCVSCCCSSAKGLTCCGDQSQGSQGPEVETVRTTHQHPERRSLRATTRSTSTSGRVSQRTSNGTVRSISEEISERQKEIRTKLRSLERHINLLFRDYTIVENRMNRLRISESRDRRYLVNRERVQEKLTMVQDSMHREYRKLCRWFQGNDVCSGQEVEQAKDRIRNVRENLKSLLRRIDRIERTIDSSTDGLYGTSTPRNEPVPRRDPPPRSGRGDPRPPPPPSLTENRHSGISLIIQDMDSLSPEVISTLEVPTSGSRSTSPDVLSPLPPPYQEEDPLPCITQRYSMQEGSTNLNREGSFRSQRLSLQEGTSSTSLLRRDSADFRFQTNGPQDSSCSSQDSSSGSSSSPGLVHRPSGVLRQRDSSPSAGARGGLLRPDSFISAAEVSLSDGEAVPVLPVLLPSGAAGSGVLTTGSGALVLHIPRDMVASSLGLGIHATTEPPPSYEEASSSQV